MNIIKQLRTRKSFTSLGISNLKFTAVKKQNLCMAVNDDVVFAQKNNSAIISLNRQKFLNALSLPMIRKIYPKLQELEEDANINIIIMKGCGQKAFCAGGDVRAIAEAGKSGGSLTKTFFKEEYKLNHRIGTLNTPFVAVIDGITMGGGVGLSVHGQFRVATERTLFAMPETAIGFFPDVGGGYFLPRLPGHLGTFLALTGHRLRGRDVLHAGIATHYIQSDMVPELENQLTSLDSKNPQDVSNILQDFHLKCISHDEGFTLKDHVQDINRAFEGNSVKKIMQNLEELNTEWSRKQLQIMEKMSPLSMCIALQQLNYGKTLSLADVLKMEYRISQGFMEGQDFYEGVRAVLVDKDNKPSWNPASVEDVEEKEVDKYFRPLDTMNELNF